MTGSLACDRYFFLLTFSWRFQAFLSTPAMHIVCDTIVQTELNRYLPDNILLVMHWIYLTFLTHVFMKFAVNAALYINDLFATTTIYFYYYSHWTLPQLLPPPKLSFFFIFQKKERKHARARVRKESSWQMYISCVEKVISLYHLLCNSCRNLACFQIRGSPIHNYTPVNVGRTIS